MEAKTMGALSRRDYLALSTAFVLQSTPALSADDTPSGPVPAAGAWGVEVSNFSATIAPGDDFFTYVNERWLQNTQAPAGYTHYVELNAMFLRTEERIKAIIDAPGEETTPAARQKIRDLYASYADIGAIERAGLAPIQADLAGIQAIRSREDIARWMARPGSHAIVGAYVFVDAADTSRNLVHLDQQILGPNIVGLPSPAAYAQLDERAVERRADYHAFIAATFERTGIERAQERAADIIALETRLATALWSGPQLRDRRANYHLMRRTDLESYAPGFPWDAYLDAKGVGAIDELILNTDTAIKASAAIFAETNLEAWKSYLLFHWIQNHADLLPAALRDAASDFGRRSFGRQGARDRESRATQFVNTYLADLIGGAYVARHFPPGFRGQLEEIAGYLKRAFSARLAAANWLDDPTRRSAQAKLDAMTIRIGYPDTLRDYAEVAIRREDPIGNLHRLRAADWEINAAQLNKPKSAWGWNMPPQAVNASFSPQLNAVVFPAGMLQPPAFDPSADPAVNFGAIGAVLAHEISHAFDDQGSRFDADGNLRDWWGSDIREHFDRRSQTLVRQYSEFSPVAGVHLNGELTLGENIADLTGVLIALDAYRSYARERYSDAAPLLDGFTGDQRFFLAYAQFWRCLETEGTLRDQAARETHAPPQYRVNGVVRNIDAWYEAFNIAEADTLYLPPHERARIW